jgi:hypothetical protein
MTYVIEPRDGRFLVVRIEADGSRKDIASYQTGAQASEGIDAIRRGDRRAHELDANDPALVGRYRILR